MAYENLGSGALDYFPCRYGKSKLLFRGPRRKLEGKYVAFLGGTATYGKFIEKPFPDLIEMATGKPSINFGCLNAGVDVFLNEPTILAAAAGASVTVIQVMGAQNISNRFYAVHPRRNDRFVQASSLLRTVFREVDFTEFHFNKHLLKTLCILSPDRYAIVRDELRNAWIARMQLLLGKVSGKSVVLWFSDHSPNDPEGDDGLGRDPLYVDQEMIEKIRPYATEVVVVTASREAMRHHTQGMAFSQMEAPLAAEMLGPKAHEEAANALHPVLKRLL